MFNQSINILGETVNYTALDRNTVKGVWLDAFSKYDFGKVQFMGQTLLLLKLKDGAEAYTPTQSRTLARRLQQENGISAVYCFDRLDFNGRERMMAQNVHFIVGDKYAYLPSLVISGRGYSKPKARELTAPAQHLLLYHLQERSLEGMSAGEMSQILPYKYVTVTLAMQVLKDLDICSTAADEDKTKRLHFTAERKALYERVLPLLRTPIRKSFYCDRVNADLDIAGTSALSRYSMLAPDSIRTVAAAERLFNLKSANCPFIGMNDWEGPYRVEIWKYPPIARNGVVDKISLALSLSSDNDPRVQKELKSMIWNIW